jgi:hypothetical protein
MIERSALVLLFLLAMAVARPSFADEPAKTATASMAPAEKKLPPGFEPVPGGDPGTPKLDPNPLVTGAYAMFFVVMFGYVIYIARSQALLSKEMGELAERVRRAEKK